MSRLARPRLASAMTAIAACVCVSPSSFLAHAQMDLAPTIRQMAGWPCEAEAWSECDVKIPPGGLNPAQWYDATRFEASSYVPELDADGVPTGAVGKEVSVGTARALYEALEDRDVSRVRVANSFLLPDLRAWRWPDEGYPVSRDVSVYADATCAGARPRDEEKEEDTAADGIGFGFGIAGGDETATSAPSPDAPNDEPAAQTRPEECVIDARQKTFLVITELGGVHMTGITLMNGGGRLGGFVHVRGGGKAVFSACAFSRGGYVPPRLRVAKHPAAAKPVVRGVTDAHGVANAHGGAVFVVNDDRLRTAEELAAARSAVAGTTAVGAVAPGGAHNVTF